MILIISLIILNIISIISIKTGNSEQIQREFNSSTREFEHLLLLYYGNLQLLRILYKSIHVIWLFNIKVPGGRIPENRQQVWMYLKEYFWLLPLL